MDEEIKNIILKEMPVLNFIVFFGVAMLGAISTLIYSVLKGINESPKTANKFNKKDFKIWEKIGRGFLVIVALALSIVEWDKVSSFLFESESSVELTIWSSFILGTIVDRWIEMLFGGSKTTVRKMQKTGTAIITMLIILNALM